MKNTSTLPVPTRTSPGQSHGRLRWGVAGTGGISRQITADFTLVDNADVVAVSSRHASSAKKFAETFGIPTSFHDYSSMLDAASQTSAIVVIARTTRKRTSSAIRDRETHRQGISPRSIR